MLNLVVKKLEFIGTLGKKSNNVQVSVLFLGQTLYFCTFLFATQQSNLLRSYLIFTFPIKNSQ